MEWADELASRVSGPQAVNDSKTPSGTVHVGSLRGPVTADPIAPALRPTGLDTTALCGVDDLDPMDAQALLTPDAIDREMGRPLAYVPDPAGACHESHARHLAPPVRATFPRDVRRDVLRARDPSRPLLLDERHLPNGRAGSLHPDGPRPGGAGPRHL